MTAFLARRLVEIPVSLFVISIMTFGLIHVAPGDPVAMMLGLNATPELVNQIHAYYGLDRPVIEQYLVWLGHVGQGDLGRSITTHQPVLQMITDRFPSTLLLALVATVVGVGLALPTGIISASRPNSRIDYAVRTLAMIGVATPNFVLAVLLILIFAVGLHLVPISGAPLLMKEPLRALPYYILPTIALGIGYAALMARLLRASMLEVLFQDYVRVAQAKGLSERTVLWVHALKNSLIPLITVLAVNFAYLLGGAAIMEQVFGLPGLGSLMIRAALERDYPLIQGISLVVASIFVLANLTADFLYSVIDPRVKTA